MVEEWGRYAPNVTMDNFISAWIATPMTLVKTGTPVCPKPVWVPLTQTTETWQIKAIPRRYPDIVCR